jgi:hypothetical protein
MFNVLHLVIALPRTSFDESSNIQVVYSMGYQKYVDEIERSLSRLNARSALLLHLHE